MVYHWQNFFVKGQGNIKNNERQQWFSRQVRLYNDYAVIKVKMINSAKSEN